MRCRSDTYSLGKGLGKRKGTSAGLSLVPRGAHNAMLSELPVYIFVIPLVVL